jgi:hypothetical protein
MGAVLFRSSRRAHRALLVHRVYQQVVLMRRSPYPIMRVDPEFRTLIETLGRETTNNKGKKVSHSKITRGLARFIEDERLDEVFCRRIKRPRGGGLL